jgi:hypothetical protein
MSIEDIDLPLGICANEFGRSLDRTIFDEVEETLEKTGVGDVVDTLARYDDAIVYCGVDGCTSFARLSHQAEQVMLQYVGPGVDSCIRPGKAPGDPLA